MPCERITSSTTPRIPKLTTLEMSNDLESMKITCETGTQGSGPSSSTSTTTITTRRAPAP